MLRERALTFLKKKDFHQTLRNEILFTVAPKTLKSGIEQRNAILGVVQTLRFGGFLRDQGFKQLGTMIKLANIIRQELNFDLKVELIDDFCQSGLFLFCDF